MNRFDLLPSVTLKTLSAQLYPDESLILHQDGVGLYDGKDKSPLHYEGRLHLTSHRLIFVSTSSTAPSPSSATIPVSLDLSLIRQTEYWTGFLKSSPKITLLLHSNNPPPDSNPPSGGVSPPSTTVTPTGGSGNDRSWICRVCGMKNVPTLELGLKCSLCGIKHEPSSTINPSSTPSIPSYPTLPPQVPSITTQTTTKALDPVETGSRITCPVCTFLNHHSMARCEMCESPLSTSSSSRTPPSSTTPRSSTPLPSNITGGSRPGTPSGGGEFVRLSFRKGGINQFYNGLKECLGKKAWDLSKGRNSQVESVVKKKSRNNGVELEADGLKKSSSGVGIDAILRGIDFDSQTRTDSLEDALKDLESLMRKAKEMIQLAQSINTQLSSSSSTTPSNSTASTLATTSLSSLGLLSSVAVTADQSRSEKEYHHSLARELGSLLQPRAGGGRKEGLIEKRGGVIGLDELWCVWNRARGVALVSPRALKLSVQYLPLYTENPRLQSLTFPQSGLTILHTPQYSPRAFKDRLLEFIEERTNRTEEGGEEGESGFEEEGGVELLDVAQREKLSLGLTKEMIELVELEEEEGRVGYGDGFVRDSGPGGGGGGQRVKWCRDWITGFEWDGQE